MIGTLIVAAALIGLIVALQHSTPRGRFAGELLMTLGVVYAVFSLDQWWVTLLTLIVWPAQLRDLARAARPAGVACLLGHLPAKRILVDDTGRLRGELHCDDPNHSHSLPAGLAALPAACRRCGKEAVG